MDIKSKFITAGGVRIHYLEAGEGDRAIVLIHGGGLDNASLSWELLLPELAQNARVIAPDLPGYGQSDKPEVTYDLAYFGNFLPQFLEALQIERVDLVGLSMGAAISLGYTLDHPQSVGHLILVDSYGFQRKAANHKLSYLLLKIPGVTALSYWAIRSQAMIRYSLKSILKRPGSITDELVERIYQQFQIPGVTSAFSDFQNAELSWSGLKTVYLERLGEIKVKTLIVHGEKDTLVPLSAAQEAHQLIQDSELKIMPGCGHWPQRDDPLEFNAVVEQFLFSEEL